MCTSPLDPSIFVRFHYDAVTTHDGRTSASWRNLEYMKRACRRECVASLSSPHLSSGPMSCFIVPSPSFLVDEGDDNGGESTLADRRSYHPQPDRMDFAPTRTLKTIQYYSSERKTRRAFDDPTIPHGHMYHACSGLYYWDDLQ